MRLDGGDGTFVPDPHAFYREPSKPSTTRRRLEWGKSASNIEGVAIKTGASCCLPIAQLRTIRLLRGATRTAALTLEAASRSTFCRSEVITTGSAGTFPPDM
jgi:hypothetical protein